MRCQLNQLSTFNKFNDIVLIFLCLSLFLFSPAGGLGVFPIIAFINFKLMIDCDGRE